MTTDKLRAALTTARQCIHELVEPVPRVQQLLAEIDAALADTEAPGEAWKGGLNPQDQQGLIRDGLKLAQENTALRALAGELAAALKDAQSHLVGVNWANRNDNVATRARAALEKARQAGIGES